MILKTRNRIFVRAGFACWAAVSVILPMIGFAQDRKQFVSDASYVVGTYEPDVAERTPESMARAAERFLQTLTDSQRKKVSGELRSEKRREWTNLPARPDADGIRLGELDEKQIRAACDLMATLYSPYGFKKMVSIMLADDQLLRGGRRRPGFGTENFSLVIFGKPSSDRPWAFQLDGHHVGFNFSFNGDKVSMSPSFIGTQPESFRIGDVKYRPLGRETDLAYQLVGSLNFEQLQSAIVSDRRGPIRLGPGQDGRVPRQTGVSGKTFNDAQKKLMLKLIACWVRNLPGKQADLRMKQIAKDLDQTSFAWSGDKQPGSDVSFVIQGPTLIIEYGCQDLGGNPLNHLHSMYRDPTNEYGGQLK